MLPVVATSSTSITCAPLKSNSDSNAPRTELERSSLFRSTCDGVCLTFLNPRSTNSISVMLAISLASNAAWLYPRSLIRFA